MNCISAETVLKCMSASNDKSSSIPLQIAFMHVRNGLWHAAQPFASMQNLHQHVLGCPSVILSADGTPALGPGPHPLATVGAAPVLDHGAAGPNGENVPPPATVEVRVIAVERCTDHLHFLLRGSLARLAFVLSGLPRWRNVFYSSCRL